MELFPAFNPGEIANILTNPNKPPNLLCPEGGYLSFTTMGQIACQISPSKHNFQVIVCFHGIIPLKLVQGFGHVKSYRSFYEPS